jgi:hydrogenase expression/formation protein HypC
MCLAIPARIASIDDTGETARVTLGGVAKEISLALVDGVEVGDYVLVHVGYALNRIDEDEAEQTLALMAEAGMLTEEPDPLADAAGGRA